MIFIIDRNLYFSFELFIVIRKHISIDTIRTSVMRRKRILFHGQE